MVMVQLCKMPMINSTMHACEKSLGLTGGKESIQSGREMQ